MIKLTTQGTEWNWFSLKDHNMETAASLFGYNSALCTENR